MKLIRIGRKFFKPHFCPGCHKFMWLVRHPEQRHCQNCQKRKRRHSSGDNSVKVSRRKYSKASYRTLKRKSLTNQGYCALCGGVKDLTCHHTVNVKTGEWQGQHLTVLCQYCHEIWEQKVSIIRSKK